jgi:hypothetical protein
VLWRLNGRNKHFVGRNAPPFRFPFKNFPYGATTPEGPPYLFFYSTMPVMPVTQIHLVAPWPLGDLEDRLNAVEYFQFWWLKKKGGRNSIHH